MYKHTICGAALILAALSLLFVPVHVDHDCIGEDCPVCAVIHVARSYVRSSNLNATHAFAKHLVPSLFTFLCVLIPVVYATPVMRKVKLNT